MIIALGSDHNATELKTLLRSALRSAGHQPFDIGCFSPTPPTDYTDIARLAAHTLTLGSCPRAILACGTGTGMAIAANKAHPSIRAATAHSLTAAIKSREHNDTSILCLGSWMQSDADNIATALAWLAASFGERRHVRRIEKLAPQRAGKLIFTNGVFDILHQGHIQLLQWAASLGERLIVGINSDRAVRALKGPARPINREADRKSVLESLRCVDEVIIFDAPSPTFLITELQPNVIVKGGEWLADDIRQRDAIPSHIDIKVFPLLTGYSTSAVISTITKAGA